MSKIDPQDIVGRAFSGASRYESGSDIPKPVQMLYIIRYGTEKQAEAMVESLRKRDA